MRTISSVTLILLALSPVLASGQGTAFTYQGHLTDEGQPANGLYDLRFSLFDASVGGSRQGSPFITNGVPVSNGSFDVTLDFGDVFPGDDRWLQIFVRTNLSTLGHTILSPRQKITPRPYAITAGKLSGTLPASQLSGTIPLAQLSGAVVTNNQNGVNFTGTFSGDGAGLTGVVPGTKYQLINGVFTNLNYDTNVVYLTGGGSPIVNQVFFWNPALSRYTNAANSIVLAQGEQWYCSNTVGRYYRCTPSSFFPSVWGTNNCIGSNPSPVGFYGTNKTYYTNQANGYSAPFAINDYKSKESFITTLGNDLTAKRGSRQFPFATLNAAATNMMPGDVLRIDAGDYYAANAIFPPNVAIIGSGPGITVITVNSTANYVFGVFLSGGGFVADATFETTNLSIQGNYQLPLHWQGSGVARNIEVYGDYDAVYGVGGSNSTNRFYDCSFFSAFDVFLTSPTSTNVHYELYGCHIKASKGYRGSVAPGANIQGLVVRQGSGSVNMYGGSIVVENGSTDTLGVLADSGSSNVVNLHNVPVFASSTNGGTVLQYTNRGNTRINLINGGITNGIQQSVYLATNAMSSWPALASTPGGFALVNSNGIPFFLLSSPGSTAWTATNRADKP